MADQFLTLLDLTARAGTDAAVGLVEDIVTVAPELDRVMGRPIQGTSYLARVRTAVHSKRAFRNANEGVPVGSAKYRQKRFDCFFFDAELQVDEALEDATGEGDSMGQLQTDEATSVMRAKAIALGDQFYRGTAADSKGHPGLIDFLNTDDLVVDAQGTSSGSFRAWFVWMDPQGVHFLFGKSRGIQLNAWTRQQVKDGSSNSLMAWVNNVSGYVGLSCAFNWSVGCVKNITSANPLTDQLGADLFSRFRIGYKPNLCFMRRDTLFGLQKSRSFTSVTNAVPADRKSDGKDVWAPEPTSIAGVPIVVTDSIVSID